MRMELIDQADNCLTITGAPLLRKAEYGWLSAELAPRLATCLSASKCEFFS